MAGADNIAGEWHGTFRYPDPSDGPATPFIAHIADRGGELTGTIIEPSHFRPETAHSVLLGRRFGTSVDFTKTYTGAGPEYEDPVDYVGQLSDDGSAIVGVWSLLEWDGSFEMYRDVESPPDVGAEVAVEIPEPVGPPTSISPRVRP